MKKIIEKIALLACLLAVLVLPYFVFAAPNSLLNNLENAGGGAGYAAADETTVSAIAGTVVAAILSLLGVIFVVLTIYSGIIWMTAEGDEQKIEKAKKTLRNAIIGLVLTVSATAIYYLVQKIFR